MSAYNRKVKILKAKAAEENDYGEKVENWIAVQSVWASFITQGGREFYAAQKMNEATQALIKMRYGNDISSKDRILYNLKTYEIIYINDVNEEHTELQISVVEVV